MDRAAAKKEATSGLPPEEKVPDPFSAEVWRYPIYDLLPEYPGMGRGGAARDVRHFIVYQWGGQEAGLYVNAILADQVGAAPGRPPVPAAAAGQNPAAVIVGDGKAGLAFDELVVADSLKSLNELRDLYISYLTGRYQPPRPRIHVTENQGAIRIDGELSEDAWKQAAALAGQHMNQSRKLLPYETTFYFTYDKDRFYVAMRTFADYPLKAMDKQRDPQREDTMVCMDDCMEVLLMPYESINYDYFHFLGNSKDYFADQLGTVQSWNGQWEYKSRVAGGVWTAELAIPYESMSSRDNKARYPGDGRQRWRFNLARNWVGALPEHWCSICYLGNYGDFWQFAQMSFERKGLTPRHKALAIEDGAAVVTLELVNTSDEPRGAVAYASAVESILPFAEAKTPVTVPAGSARDVTLRLPLEGKAEAWIEWGVTDAGSGEYLLRSSGRLPLVEGGAEAYTRAVAEEQARRSKLTAGKAAAEPEAASSKKPKADEAILWPTQDAVNEAMEKRTLWKNNQLGMSDKVPPPWSPVTVSGEKVSVWSRTYDFGGSLILGGAAAGGRDILAGPVALVVEKDGKQTRYEKAKTAVVGRNDRRVDLLAVGGDEKLTVSARTWVEFDGCIWVEMKLLPHENIAFDRMWLEAPYKSSAARNYSYWIDKESGSDAGKVPEDGLRLTYRPYVWLGDVPAGMCWWHCDAREWFIEDPERTDMVFVRPDPLEGTTRLQIMIAASPGVLSETMALEFGLMATPVRPMPQDWRRYDFFCGWSKLKGQFAEWGTGYFVKWPDDPDDMRRRLDQYAKRDPYILPTPNVGSYFYTETNYKDGRTLPDWWLWQSDFSAGDGRGMQYKRQVWTAPSQADFYAGGYTTAVPSREYTDLYLYNYHKLMTEFPLLRGIYMDSCVHEVDNPVAGEGYVDRFGRRRPTWQIMNSREFLKRVYTMFWQLRGDPKDNPWVVYVHCSNQVCPPIHSFATSILQGEGVSVGPRALGDHPVGALTMEDLRVAYNSHAFGWIDQFLGLYSENPETIGELTAMFLLHDHNEMGRGDRRTAARFDTVMAASNLTGPDAEVQFLPYWNNGGAVVSETDGGFVNAYVKKGEGRVILVAASLKLPDAPTRIDLRIDPGKLSLPAGRLLLRDLYTGQTIPVVDGAVGLAIRKNDFRVLELKAAAE